MRYLLICILISVKAYSQCWESVSVSDNHVLAIASDGSLWSWGSNNYAKLGFYGIPANEPTHVGNESDWTLVSAGAYHSFALKNDNQLYGWGGNYYGQIGSGNGLDIVPFYDLVNNFNWQTIKSGNEFSIAIKSDGTLWTWGLNSAGQLGDGTILNKSLPTQLGNNQDWQTIAIGYTKSYGIKANGTLWTWGPNPPSQVGSDNNWLVITNEYAIMNDGTLWDISSNPIQIGSDTDWISVSRNFQGNHILALKNNGTLWAWSNDIYYGNSDGELGDGTNTVSTSPIQIGSDSNWNFVSAGEKFSIALKTDGSLWSWGRNGLGQLGDGSFVSKNFPIQVDCPSLSIDDFNNRNKLVVYPNPTQNSLYINFEEMSNIDIIIIYDVMGKILFQDSKITNYINVANLETGLYIIKIKTKQKIYESKFIKN